MSDFIRTIAVDESQNSLVDDVDEEVIWGFVLPHLYTEQKVN
jgi:hypothetical protein